MSIHWFGPLDCGKFNCAKAKQAWLKAFDAKERAWEQYKAYDTRYHTAQHSYQQDKTAAGSRLLSSLKRDRDKWEYEITQQHETMRHITAAIEHCCQHELK
jgi:mannitol-1-phosphate/altronate dehydrogenase